MLQSQLIQKVLEDVGAADQREGARMLEEAIFNGIRDIL